MKPANVVTDFGGYTLAFQKDKDYMTIEQHLSLKMSEVPAARRADYVAFRRSVVDEVRSASKAEGGKSTEGEKEESPAKALYEAAKRSEGNRDYAGSAELFREAVEKDPGFVSAWNALGWSYTQLQEYDSAEVALRKAASLDPGAGYVRVNLGYALSRQKKYAEAIEQYNKAIELNPDNVEVHSYLGFVYLSTQKYQDAVKQYEIAAQGLPKNVAVQYNLGKVYAKTGQPDKAMEALRRDVELQPTPANLSEVSWEMAQDKLDLDQARKYSASSIEAVESQLNDVSLEYLSEHDIQLQGSLPYYWDTLGWIAFEQAKYSEAEKYLRAAGQISGHGEIGDHLGQLYEKLGRKQEAIEAYAGSLGSAEPMDGTKERLGALVGGAAGSDRDAKMARETKAASEAWQRSRTARVQNAHGAAGAAEYWILLEPGAPGIVPVSVAAAGAGSAGAGSAVAGSAGASATGVSSVGTNSAAAGWEIASQAREVKFISGDDALKDAGSEIQKAKFEDEFVDGVGKHILRRGRLNCAQSAPECTLELETTDSVRQVK